MITDSEHNDDFEAYLKRRVPVDRRLALIDRLEPPPELDRIIIGQARLAIQGPAPMPVFRAPKWALPMGLAATILVSLSILLDLGMRDAIRKDAGHSQASAALEQPFAEITVPLDGPPALEAAAPSPAPAPPVTPSANRSPASALARSAARMKAPPIKTAPWTSLPRSDTPAPEPALLEETVVTGYVSGSAHYGARGRVTEHDLAANRLRTAEKPSGSADPMETVIVTATRDHFESQTVNAISVTAFPQGGVSEDTTTLAASPAAATPNIHIETGSARQSARAGVGSAAERRKHPDPRAWLDYIEKMRAQGLTGEAEQEFRHFRDVYPGYSVPPEAAPADGRPQ
jgi:hypothetical protein